MQIKSQLAAEDKRRSWTISIVFHSVLFLLGIIPFLINEPQQEVAQAIMIDFQDFASKSSGNRSGSASSAKSPRPTVALNTLSATRPSQPMPKPQIQVPVITAPNPDVTVPEPRETYFEQDFESSEVSEQDVVEELSNPEPDPGQQFQEFSIADAEDQSGEPSPLSGVGESAEGSDPFSDGKWPGDVGTDGEGESDESIADGLFDGDWPGELDGTEGTTLGVGEDGDGNMWGDFAGDGLFNRKVIERANVASLAKQDGKVVINLCVDRSGKVTYAACDKSKSTISDGAIIARSEFCATNYVFDQDPTAPEEQCGRLTFIFKIER